MRRWFRIERPPGIWVHPSKTIELALPPAAALNRCADGIERVLGGVIQERDDARGRIEATFGLIFSERLTCTVTEAAKGARVSIESRRGAQLEPPKTSSYVEALADYLMEAEPK